jgi:hypothetical protein
LQTSNFWHCREIVSMTREQSCVNELPRWLIIGFSGHRHLGEKAKDVEDWINTILDRLSLQYLHFAGVASAASGADTLFGEEILRRSAPLSIVLPFAAARFEKDFENEPPNAWARAGEIIRQAIDLDVVHQLDSDVASLTELQHGQNDRVIEARSRDDEAYLEATARTVDRADILLAAWNGKPGGGRGGTADAVHYARRIGLPLILFDPETKTVVEERMEFLPDRQKLAPVQLSSPRQLVAQHLEDLDRDASSHGPKARRVLRTFVYIHLLAATVATTGIVLGIGRTYSIIASCIEVALLAFAFVLLRGRVSQHYKTWLPQRVAAEICRSFLSTWDIRRSSSIGNRPPTPRQHRLFRDLRFLRHLDRSPLPPLEDLKLNYLDSRLDDQLGYFGQKLREATKPYKIQSLLSKVCSLGAMLASVSVLILTLDDAVDRFVHVAEFLSIVLPLATSAAGVLMVTQETSRRVERYEVMKETLERLKPLVEAAPTRESLARAVTKVEEELLQELVEWSAFLQHTEHLH